MTQVCVLGQSFWLFQISRFGSGYGKYGAGLIQIPFCARNSRLQVVGKGFAGMFGFLKADIHALTRFVVRLEQFDPKFAREHTVYRPPNTKTYRAGPRSCRLLAIARKSQKRVFRVGEPGSVFRTKPNRRSKSAYNADRGHPNFGYDGLRGPSYIEYFRIRIFGDASLC